ncbi:MAG: alpha/beta hydrolase [Actinomycetota bacterium]|nr:alpha/beta hydrolase [Actinomycetota bacterium]
MTEELIDVAGTKIFTRRSGEGPVVLLLHGFPQTGHCWRYVARHLQKRFDVIVPDVPGFGRSDRPPESDAGAVAAVLDDYLDRLGVEKATIVGHDWGGAFSFRMALDHQPRVERLVITNSPFREMSLWRAWYIMYFNIPLLPELSFRALGNRLIEGALKGGSRGRGVFDDAAVRVYQDAYATNERVVSALAYYRTTTRRSLAKQVRGRFRGGRGSLRPTGIEGDRPRRIVAPTLLVWGMKDPVLTPALIPGIVREIPHAEVVELDEVGHFVPEEAPSELGEAIERFAAPAS